MKLTYKQVYFQSHETESWVKTHRGFEEYLMQGESPFKWAIPDNHHNVVQGSPPHQIMNLQVEDIKERTFQRVQNITESSEEGFAEKVSKNLFRRKPSKANPVHLEDLIAKPGWNRILDLVTDQRDHIKWQIKDIKDQST